jgi:hypothetical protein
MNSTNFGSIVSPVGLTEEHRRLVRKYAGGGKVETVMHEFKHGKLRSGSKKGPVVTSRKQAIAIALNEKRRYGQAKGGSWWSQLQQEIADMGPPARGPLTG